MCAHGGFSFFPVVCGGLRWFAVICGYLWCHGLSFSHTRFASLIISRVTGSGPTAKTRVGSSFRDLYTECDFTWIFLFLLPFFPLLTAGSCAEFHGNRSWVI